MLKAYKTELKPNEEQLFIIRKTMGVGRYVYNLFLDVNRQRYETDYWYMNAYAFSKWLNNDYLEANPTEMWIKSVHAKSIKQSIINADQAMKKFFKRQAGFPKFKSRKRDWGSFYFFKNGSKQFIDCERHRIKIPTLGWVRIKEKGYIPTDKNNFVIKSGTIKEKANRYYLSIIVEQQDTKKQVTNAEPIGIDLGVKTFAVLSTGESKPTINKLSHIRKTRKSLKRQQRKLSRRYEALKIRKFKMKRGESATEFNLDKQKLKVQKLHQHLTNITKDHHNKFVHELATTKPSYIAIEDLNVKGMMKNRHLSKAVAQQGFYDFRIRLTNKCKELGISLHVVNRFESTSKICHNCGHKKIDLKLSDRIYHCDNCGYTTDRDYNAALNIRDTQNFKLAL
ncbi:RNA-guided endonuclease InsQ/TnpB family protein [Sporolactobacillus nakayamae]|uniref:Putative transposase n=1 Tax=Sporolactobacillus nakayamae TaxID=269670 RepID=A0A1I2TKC1_9BACL|nr:RNA-guided endonuclease TnpB family protein [Sporolactobacillus nakayamae]SFG65263.1 putative transposase [Sporolactobacillus nakayamae]